jgi:PKHD-type hydroxylase
MTYGEHVDDPVMGAPGQLYRSDVSITIFLSDPEEYDGGELVIRAPYGEHSVKLPAGDAVMYPSSSLHRVNPVTRGVRLAAVTWVQSLVRDAARRELLYELNRVREALLRDTPGGEETARLNMVYVNLVRMWSEV